MARKVTFGQKRKKAAYLFLHILNFAARKSGRRVEMRVSYHLVLFLKICYCFLIQNTAAYSKMQIWVEQSYWAKTQQQIHEKHTAAYCHIFMDVVPSYAEISFVNFIRFLTFFLFFFLTSNILAYHDDHFFFGGGGGVLFCFSLLRLGFTGKGFKYSQFQVHF